jgi:hypothetical protein
VSDAVAVSQGDGKEEALCDCSSDGVCDAAGHCDGDGETVGEAEALGGRDGDCVARALGEMDSEVVSEADAEGDPAAPQQRRSIKKAHIRRPAPRTRV